MIAKLRRDRFQLEHFEHATPAEQGPCEFAHMAYYMRNFIHSRFPCRAPLSNKTSDVELLPGCSQEHTINRQAELVDLLRTEGFPATQSSVSRDLRDFGAAKAKNGYSLPNRDELSNASSLQVVAELVRDIRPAGPNLLVIMTAVGAAQRVAVTLDRIDWPEVVGTLSGDDTIFVATVGAPPATPAPRPVTATSEKGIDMSASANPIVLAFSGGLDTSFCVPWLKETYGRPVVTVTVNMRRASTRPRRRSSTSAPGRLAPSITLDRGALRVLRQRHQVSDHGQRAARQMYPLSRGRRAGRAGEISREARHRARRGYRRARLHCRRQRSGAFRDRVEDTSRRSSRSWRPCATTLGARAAQVKFLEERGMPVPVERLGLLDQPRPLGSDDRRHGDARLEGQHSRNRRGCSPAGALDEAAARSARSRSSSTRGVPVGARRRSARRR